MVSTITPEQLQQKKSEQPNLRLIDVRTPAEFQSVHVEYAQSIPLDRLDPAQLATEAKTDPLYVICKSGARGKQACEKLTAAGCEQVHNVSGGTDACVAAGLPVERGTETMSLERQVRIAAGSLVFIGAALGVFVHPYWIGLSAFVGAGLVFAGVTDTCGMGMLIAKLPWNQAGGCCAR